MSKRRITWHRSDLNIELEEGTRPSEIVRPLTKQVSLRTKLLLSRSISSLRAVPPSLRSTGSSSSSAIGRSESGSSVGGVATTLDELLKQAAAGDPPLCDLSAHEQLSRASTEKKNIVLGQLARATKLGAIVLHNLNLDDTNAPAIAAILRANDGLGLLSVERNQLREGGLLAIAAAANGHPSLRELRVGEQKEAISTAATTALVAVMEATPCLLKLGVGSVRDELLLKRLEAATMANTDLVRQHRVRVRATGDKPEVEPEWVALWEARAALPQSPSQQKKKRLLGRSLLRKGALDAVAGFAPIRRRSHVEISTPAAGTIAAKAALVKGQLAPQLASQHSAAMASHDWAAEAWRIAADEVTDPLGPPLLTNPCHPSPASPPHVPRGR